MGEIIAVLSGKGGTGKTSVCAGLGCALAALGKRVLCIDCDVGLRNLDLALGLSESGSPSFLDILQGNYSLDQATVHPQFPTLSFLTAPIASVSSIDGEAFGQLLSGAKAKFDFVLLDAPAGIDRGFVLCAKFAGRVLVVTGAEPAAIRDARQAADLLEQMGKTNVRLIVNRVRPRVLRSMSLTVDDVMDQAGLPVLGLVPEDVNVVLAPSYGQALLAFSKRCGAAKACRRIAKRIVGFSVPITI